MKLRLALVGSVLLFGGALSAQVTFDRILHAALYFGFFILTDPPTSPTKHRDQITCGALVAVVSYVVFEWLGAVYYLLAGVLIGNLWEAWRRWTTYRRRHSAKVHGQVIESV